VAAVAALRGRIVVGTVGGDNESIAAVQAVAAVPGRDAPVLAPTSVIVPKLMARRRAAAADELPGPAVLGRAAAATTLVGFDDAADANTVAAAAVLVGRNNAEGAVAADAESAAAASLVDFLANGNALDAAAVAVAR
jgi:hypothetical protein